MPFTGMHLLSLTKKIAFRVGMKPAGSQFLARFNTEVYKLFQLFKVQVPKVACQVQWLCSQDIGTLTNGNKIN